MPAGEISWKLLHDVYDRDLQLQSHLRQAPKLTYRALHPGNNKQNVNLALAIFHPSTTAAIKSYFPERNDAAEFLTLIFKWWTVVNSKQMKSNNWLGHGAVKDDNKPDFLRKLADWFEEWQSLNLTNCQNVTPSGQTSSAMIISLRCMASLTEDLLNEGYDFVLTGRFQTDHCELNIGKVRGMSGGRFLVSLTEVMRSESIILLQSLLKESIDIWDEDLHPEKEEINEATVEGVIGHLHNDIAQCFLSDDTTQVSSVVGGYIQKKLLKRTKCGKCNIILQPTSCNTLDVPQQYLSLLSRGGLITPSKSMAGYVSKSFAILDLVEDPIHRSSYPARKLAEKILSRNKMPGDFVCDEHYEWGTKFTNRIVANVFYNNRQKESIDSVRQNGVKSFKQRQRKKRKDDGE